LVGAWGRCNDWGRGRGVSRCLWLVGGGSRTAMLAVKRSGGVEMADRDGERVGGIGGFGNLIEPEQLRDHLLNLVLLGSAVADHG